MYHQTLSIEVSFCLLSFQLSFGISFRVKIRFWKKKSISIESWPANLFFNESKYTQYDNMYHSQIHFFFYICVYMGWNRNGICQIGTEIEINLKYLDTTMIMIIFKHFSSLSDMCDVLTINYCFAEFCCHLPKCVNIENNKFYILLVQC